MKKGDEYSDFLGGLYLSHFNSMWGYAYRLTGNKDTADDIVHTVFLNVVKHTRKLQRIDSEAKVKAYLNAAVRNTCHNHVKKEARCPVAAGLHEIDGISSGFLVDDLVITVETMREALEQLTPLQQDLLVLSCYVGLSHKEISDITGLTVGNVGVSLFRVRLAVKAFFEFG